MRGLLRSIVFFPVLVSTVAVGITFSVLLAPDTGLVNTALGVVGVSGPGLARRPDTALLSVALVDVWKGVGLATVIYIAGDPVHPAATTTRPSPSTAAGRWQSSGTSPCRWPGRPRSR